LRNIKLLQEASTMMSKRSRTVTLMAPNTMRKKRRHNPILKRTEKASPTINSSSNSPLKSEAMIEKNRAFYHFLGISYGMVE